MPNYILPALVFGPVILGIIAFILPRKLQWWLFFLMNAALITVVLKLHGSWNMAYIYKMAFSVPHERLILGFGMSHLGWFFLAVTLIATVLFSLFSLGFNDKKHITAVAPLWMMLVGATNGIFLAKDWVTFFIVWELMSWTSLLVIGHGKLRSFKAGIFYYLLSLFGTFAMFMAMWLVFYRTGTFDINASVYQIAADAVRYKGFALLIIILFSIAFFAKSALFPFHMWPSLAHAEAPDDFSAYLSGVMIKYGVYGLLLVIVPIFAVAPKGALKTVAGIPMPLYVMAWISAITAVLGTIFAIFSNDMKRLMAFSTVANVGYIGTALATGSALGYAAALFHTVNHMIFKGAIFASLASVKFRTGEREMHKLGGLAYVMPITFFTFLLGIIAAAGIPPLGGFNSKWMIFQALFQKKLVFLATALFFASTGAFLYLFRALHTIFLGQLSPRFAKVKEAPFFMSLSMILLMVLMLLPGVYPGLVVKPINGVLSSFGFIPIKSTYSVISGSTASINATVISAVFGGAIVLVFIMFLLGAKKRKIEMLDNYMCGEVPEDWDLTPELYHYGYKFYHPIRPLFKWVPFGAVENMYRQLSRSLHRFGSFMADLWRAGGTLAWSLIFGFAFILIMGVM